MRQQAVRTFVRYHDWQIRRRMDRDEQGLSLVAYALGAAFIVIPMAIALFLFGKDASDRADTDLQLLLSASTPSLP